MLDGKDPGDVSHEAKDDTTPILIDFMTASDYGDLARTVKLLDRASCDTSPRHLERPTTVQEFAGGRVKTIRLFRSAPKNNPLKVAELRESLRHVWRSKFQNASCGIEWSQGAPWSIESVLEFEDGERGALITDGVHVALQDHDGKSWFFRLLPAAQ